MGLEKYSALCRNKGAGNSSLQVIADHKDDKGALMPILQKRRRYMVIYLLKYRP